MMTGKNWTHLERRNLLKMGLGRWEELLGKSGEGRKKNEGEGEKEGGKGGRKGGRGREEGGGSE